MTFYESLHRYRIELLLTLVLVSLLYGRSVAGMVGDWYRDDNYAHGFLVPLIAGYFIYERWDDLKASRVVPSLAGLAIVLVALLQLTIGTVGLEYFTIRSSLVVLVAGIVLFIWGSGVFRTLRLPIGYLLFMVPLPYIIHDQIAFPLKQFVSRVSVAVMHLLGVTVVRDGNIIMFPGITLEVADACSGIRSLVSILALSIAYAFFLQISPLKRWIVILSSIVIAIAANALRVIITGILASYHGARVAEGFFHEFAGLAVFALAMAMLVALGLLLRGKAS